MTANSASPRFRALVPAGDPADLRRRAARAVAAVRALLHRRVRRRAQRRDVRAQLQHARRRAEFRFDGGSQVIAHRLAKRLGHARRCCARRSSRIVAGPGRRARGVAPPDVITAKRVIVAVPPVLAGRIDYSPDLPASAHAAHAADAAGHPAQGHRRLRPAVLARQGPQRHGGVAERAR